MLRVLLLVCFLLVAVVAPSAQNPPLTPPLTPPLPDASRPRGDRRPPTPDEIRRQQAMEKERTKQRYRDLRKDTDHLLDLASQLKKDVDAAGEQTLSLAVVKKADEIEKLAKSVKQKMKGD